MCTNWFGVETAMKMTTVRMSLGANSKYYKLVLQSQSQLASAPLLEFSCLGI